MIQRNQGTIPVGGTTNPVYMLRARIMTAEGTRAWTSVRDMAPKVRNSVDMTRVVTKEKSRKMKKAEGVRRRFVMKYSTRLKKMALPVLYGRSQMKEAIASAEGW